MRRTLGLVAALFVVVGCGTAEKERIDDGGASAPTLETDGDTTLSDTAMSADSATSENSLPADSVSDDTASFSSETEDTGREPTDGGLETQPTEPTDAAVTTLPDAGLQDAAASVDASTELLRADPGSARYALVGEAVLLDGSASTGAVSYEWFSGNGEPAVASSDPVLQVVYAAPGRYQAVLTVVDEEGNRHAAGVTISVTHPAVEFGTYSRTLATVPGTDDVVVVSSDADQLIVLSPSPEGEWTVSRRIDTCDAPRTVTVVGAYFATACQKADRLGFYPLAGGAANELTLPYGAAPFGVATDGTRLFASLQGSGSLLVVNVDGAVPEIEATLAAIPDARAVAALPDGRVAVTRWRSPDQQGELALVDLEGAAPEIVTLGFDPQVASDAEIGGVPSYLAEFAPSPTGLEAFIPSLMANHTEGGFKSGRALTFETTLRAALSRVNLATSSEDFAARHQFDERGFAEAMAFSSRGDFGYLVMPGNRSAVILDLLTGVESGVLLDAGFAPDGAVVVNEDRTLLVNAALSREVVVYDLTRTSPLPVVRVPLLESEPLDPVVLRGKQLFNDAADPRLARSGYIACAHCHLDGDSDRRVWDFTDRGEGLRNTISLLGRAGTGDGPVHWSANFDEIQDFEHDIRNAFGGTGLMDEADFLSGTRNTTLGDAKAGLSDDLDALALYVASLQSELKSPFRTADGSLNEAALRGKALFETVELGCSTCHLGPRLTDSQLLAPADPLLHNVGTFGLGSGQRLGATLSGLDTPTLHGLWNSGPYLHDGSAATLDEVLSDRNPSDLHGVTSTLSALEHDDLVAYLLSLDGAVE